MQRWFLEPENVQLNRSVAMAGGEGEGGGGDAWWDACVHGQRMAVL
jgi:hypothetical protein